MHEMGIAAELADTARRFNSQDSSLTGAGLDELTVLFNRMHRRTCPV
jgi:hypothetical protein